MKTQILLAFLFASVFTTAQVGIGTNNPKATLHVSEDLTTNNTLGIIPPRVPSSKLNQLKNLYTNEHHGTIVFVTDVDEIASEKTQKVTGLGYYYYHHPQGNNVSGEWRGLGQQSNDSKFFYMPSVILPTTEAMVTAMANANIAYNDGTYFVDLYEIFKAQFDTPIKSSNGTASGLQGFVLPREAYEYHIIYADNTVFPHTDINFLADAGKEGKLTYKVNANAIIRNGSFMNIVLKIK